ALREALLAEGVWPEALPAPRAFMETIERRSVAVVDLRPPPDLGVSVAQERAIQRAIQGTAELAGAQAVVFLRHGAPAEALLGHVAVPSARGRAPRGASGRSRGPARRRELPRGAPGRRRCAPRSSGVHAREHARERDHLAQVVTADEPRQQALQPQPEPGVGHGAVPPEVEVPLERLAREAVLGDALLEERQVVDALRAADQLAVALGEDQVGG